MNDLLLCKPGEIFLKGLNKHYFEERLVANVKRRLKPIGHFRVTYLQSATKRCTVVQLKGVLLYD